MADCCTGAGLRRDHVVQHVEMRLDHIIGSAYRLYLQVCVN